ncbi:hypothetical protein [Xenorhabdus hominickii]|uniref:Uncharacterized protein n=1 Tax=Xenorhabdus hominickii TaxID=351679 RepID=A0A1V0M4Q1_XENHO|nr:hypothetical protein [Xenorhabdus hominickii]ARD69855.1 hypothetical protein [Xenorhabdus hominickii]PHM51868.1 hypothetical protein Xhom_04707 [Xenorhabdus hominickii]
MDAFSDRIFEERYKDFLKIRSEWMKIVFNHAVYVDINAQGKASRPVAILTDKSSLNRSEELRLAWQQFAEWAEHKRIAGLSSVPVQIYSPVPDILKAVKTFTIGGFEATSTQNFLREEILRKIDKKLKLLHKTKDKNYFYIIDLEQDKNMMAQYPEGTRFRRRISGYTDVVLDIGTDKKSTQKLTRRKSIKNPKDERYRVGAHGIIIDGNSLNAPDAYDIYCGEKPISRYFDLISPVRCSLFTGGSLYLIADIERAKAARQITAASLAKTNPIPRKKSDPTQKEQQRLHRIAQEKQKAQQYVQQKTTDWLSSVQATDEQSS